LPSITPSYLYTFIALIAVCSLLIFSSMAYTNTIRAFSEINKLKNLMDLLAAKSTELLTLAQTTNATAETFIQMPTTIGNKQYWLQLCNDSSKAWVEGGFGNNPQEETELRVYLPKEVSASGYYTAGYGAAHLLCHVNNGVAQVRLTSFVEG
jgi:hypothetical protein